MMRVSAESPPMRFDMNDSPPISSADIDCPATAVGRRRNGGA